MTDQILVLLRDVARLSNDHIADECPRHESEPFISIWEKANRLVADRASTHLYDEISGDHRKAVHAKPADVIERLKAMRNRLSAADPDGRGMYGEIAAIGQSLSETLTFA